MEEAIAAANGQDHRPALVILDLNRFKEVNDTLGHPTGDALISLVGPRLESALGSSA